MQRNGDSIRDLVKISNCSPEKSLSIVSTTVACYAMYQYHELTLIVKLRPFIMVYLYHDNLLPTSAPVPYDESMSDKSPNDS
jgi:hypothetical protein